MLSGSPITSSFRPLGVSPVVVSIILSAALELICTSSTITPICTFSTHLLGVSHVILCIIRYRILSAALALISTSSALNTKQHPIFPPAWRVPCSRVQRVHSCL
jgi:hypothetical protein